MLPNNNPLTTRVACSRHAAGLSSTRAGQRGYILLETVIATGLLIVALAAIGVQVQRSRNAIKDMGLRIRALALAEQQFAELDLGLVELDSLDEVVEGDFGPRHPDWGWRLITEPTSIDELFLLTVEVLHFPREDEYREDDFDYDHARTIHTARAFRPAPQAIDFAQDFGMTEDEVTKFYDKVAEACPPGMDPQNFDPGVFAKHDFEVLITCLPVLMDAFGFEFEDLVGTLPPDVLQQIRESGLFGMEGEEDQDDPNGGEEQ